MEYWYIWIIVGILLIGVELMTTSLYVGCIGLAAVVTGLVTIYSQSLPIQLTVFSVIGILLFILLRPLYKRYVKSVKVTATNTDALIGKKARVSETIDLSLGTGRVLVDGDDWKAVCKSENQTIQIGKVVTIIKQESLVLIVE